MNKMNGYIRIKRNNDRLNDLNTYTIDERINEAQANIKISELQSSRILLEPQNNNLKAQDSETYRLSVKIKGSNDVIGWARFKYTHYKGTRTALTTYSEAMTIDRSNRTIEVIYDTMQSTSGQSVGLELELQQGEVWLENGRLEKLQRHNCLELPDTMELDISQGIKEATIELKKDEGENKDSRLLWITSDETIVEVRDGILRPRRSGIVTITVMTKDRMVRDSCQVTVKGEIPKEQRVNIESINLSVTQKDLEIDKTIELYVKVSPEQAMYNELIWSSSNESVANILAGRVTGRSEGQATITVTTPNGIRESCLITVIPNRIDDFDRMIESWRMKCVQKTPHTSWQEAIKDWETLDKNNSRKGLWYEPTVTIPRVWPSDKINKDVTRLSAMSELATDKDSPLKGNQYLIQDVVKATLWIYENCFGPNHFMEYTWWQWEIGIPQIINNIFVRLHRYFTQDEISKVMTYIHQDLMPYPEYMEYIAGGKLRNTGANLIDQIKTAMIPAMFMKDGVKIEKCKELLLKSLEEVTTGDGFYKDGSFIQHLDIAYTGSYGAVYLEGVTNLLDVLVGTEYEIAGVQAEKIYRILEKSYLPLLYRGKIMDMVKGRAIVRKNKNTPIENKYSVIINSIRLAYCVSEPYRTNILSRCKYMIQQILKTEDMQLISEYIIERITQLLEDDTIETKVPLCSHKEYGGMNRTVHHEAHFSIGISKSSKRIKTYEVTNYENQKGWHTGDGMMYLYNEDLDHYDGEYWVTVDWNKLPGVTADPYRKRSWGSQSSGDSQGTPKNDWAGGVTFQNKCGLSGMRLQTLDGEIATDLTANKSWFIFDEGVIALGSGISSTHSRMIETTIEQRRIRGNNIFVVDGIEQPNELGWENELDSVSWMYLAGNEIGAEIGYYFPQPTNVRAKRMTQTGTYHEISVNSDQEVYANHFITLWLEHGINPVSEKYAYAILPGKTPKDMEKYIQNPSFEILIHEDNLHVVKHLYHNLIAVNSYDKGVREIGFIKVDGCIACIIQEEDGKLNLAIADPTMERDQVVLELKDRTYIEVIECNERIHIEQLKECIRVTVDTSNSFSQSFEVKLKIIKRRIQ